MSPVRGAPTVYAPERTSNCATATEDVSFCGRSVATDGVAELSASHFVPAIRARNATLGGDATWNWLPDNASAGAQDSRVYCKAVVTVSAGPVCVAERAQVLPAPVIRKSNGGYVGFT